MQVTPPISQIIDRPPSVALDHPLHIPAPHFSLIMDMVIYRIAGDINYYITLNDVLRFVGFGFSIVSAIWCGMLIHTRLANTKKDET